MAPRVEGAVVIVSLIAPGNPRELLTDNRMVPCSETITGELRGADLPSTKETTAQSPHSCRYNCGAAVSWRRAQCKQEARPVSCAEPEETPRRALCGSRYYRWRPCPNADWSVAQR
jgi:hypothetical protein